MLTQTTDFVNALPENAESSISLAVLLRHRLTDDERLVDLLVENDRLATVLKAIRANFPKVWTIEETWVIEHDELIGDRYVPLVEDAWCDKHGTEFPIRDGCPDCANAVIRQRLADHIALLAA